MSTSNEGFTRRTLLYLVPLAAAGLAIGCAESNAEAPPNGDFRPNVFVHIQPDGLVNLVCHRSEMGQGVRSTLPAWAGVDRSIRTA